MTIEEPVPMPMCLIRGSLCGAPLVVSPVATPCAALWTAVHAKGEQPNPPALESVEAWTHHAMSLDEVKTCGGTASFYSAPARRLAEVLAAVDAPDVSTPTMRGSWSGISNGDSIVAVGLQQGKTLRPEVMHHIVLLLRGETHMLKDNHLA